MAATPGPDPYASRIPSYGGLVTQRAAHSFSGIIPAERAGLYCSCPAWSPGVGDIFVILRFRIVSNALLSESQTRYRKRCFFIVRKWIGKGFLQYDKMGGMGKCFR